MILKRLKNLWRWSALEPPAYTERDYTKSYVKPWFSPEIAEIIYPNKRKELLQAKSDPSIDELLNL